MAKDTTRRSFPVGEDWKRDDEILNCALEIIESRLKEGAAAEGAARHENSLEQERLSAAAWRRLLRALGLYDEAAVVAVERALMRTAPHAGQPGDPYPRTRSYIHLTSRLIEDGFWRQPAGGGAPSHPGAIDPERVNNELRALVESGVFVACELAVNDLARRNPAAFGTVDDPAAEARRKAAVHEHAAALARRLAEHEEFLLVLAHRRGIAFEPRENLVARLIAHELNPVPPAPEKRRHFTGTALFGPSEMARA